MNDRTGGDRTFYLTTPIYYVNDTPHIGHAYTSLACDVLARFARLDGQRVFFLTGCDEHGQKVARSAREAGQEPMAFCDRVSGHFRHLARALDISNDDFVRTTEPRHIAAVQALWNRLEARNQIYRGNYCGWYAVRDEAFHDESELETGADGRKYAPGGAEVSWVEEPGHFFRLSAWQDRLLDLYENNPGFVMPRSRRNEVISFVRSGLKDLSVSRSSFSWGVPVPGAGGHVVYVWLDALANYLTAAGWPDTGCPRWKELWPAALHMVGKDILRFHAVYWPAFLMAADLPVPGRVFAHGWWTNEGQKISKSLGNVIDPLEVIREYGLDHSRYFLMREIPFGNDGDFSRRALVRRVNAELVHGFGNLVHRVLSLIGRNSGGTVPAPGDSTPADMAFAGEIDAVFPGMRAALRDQEIHTAIGCWVGGVAAANRYIDVMAPWKLKREDPVRMATVLWILAESIRKLAILIQPVIPDGAARVLDLLGQGETGRDFGALSRPLAPGTVLPEPRIIFPVLDEGENAGASAP